MAASTVGLIPNWFPPTRDNYELILSVWKWFPLAASLQWIIPWYGMGKTSVDSRLNLPGRAGWLVMEVPGFVTLLYHLRTLPGQAGVDGEEGLPWQNKVLAALFVMHYAYRAVVFPFLQPSMSPLHPLILAFGLVFQLTNGLCIGSFLAAYGPTTPSAWSAHLSPLPTLQFTLGITLFHLGLLANYYHDDALRLIRTRHQARGGGKASGKGAEKHYEIPTAGLFKVVLYPHYLAEWVEWFGFWMAAGWGCVPARCFFLNEVAAMLPRAVRGKRWYVERFGADKVGKRKAVIPGVW